jgi:hypothetical protein
MDTGEVYAVVQNPDGTTSVDIYTPALGVTSAELYRQLQHSGKAGLVDPSAAAGRSSLQTDCSIEGAYALNRLCGLARYHWARLGSDPRPVVWFQDFTGSAWPVSSSVITWNASAVIDSRYQSPGHNCPGNCVVLSNANYGPVNWVGRTSWRVQGTLITSGTYIQFNDYCGPGYTCGAAWHRQAVCHEMGHALGLDHNVNASSCLYYQMSGATIPASGDWKMLESIY